MNMVDKAFEIVLGIVAFLGGMWIKNLQDNQARMAQDMQTIRDNYQRRDDAKRDFEIIKEMLTDISRKLDKKADK